jgi:hypothetical protein
MLAIRVSAERTGFIKVSRDTTTPITSRIYASIDRQICATRLRPGMDIFATNEDLVNLDGHRNIFPHAVLQVRWEGDSPRWLEELNTSHLIERINGFDVFVHAVAVLAGQKAGKMPYWVNQPTPSYPFVSGVALMVVTVTEERYTKITTFYQGKCAQTR